MDREIVYSGTVPLETDLLHTNMNAYLAFGSMIQSVMGSNTVVDGLACTPGTGLYVSVAAGSIYSIETVDTTAYSSLGTNSNQVMKQGLLASDVRLSCPAPATVGYSIVYLIEAQFSESDGTPVVLPFYNAANPTIAWNGPSGNGTSVNTIRSDTVALKVKAGTAATTGTQVAPTVDSGWTALYTVTVAYGATSISSGNIAVVLNAPFIPMRLPQAQAINNFIFNGNTTLNPPTTAGTMTLINNAASGTQVVTLDATAIPNINNLLLSVISLNGATTQIETPAGVYVTLPATANSAAQTWIPLLSNALEQGPWGGNTTYGRNTSLGVISLNVPVSKGLATVNLSSTLTIFAVSTSSGLKLTAYNPTTNTAGSTVTIAGLSLQQVAGLFALSATSFCCITSGYMGASSAIAGSVSGLSISTGTAATLAIYSSGDYGIGTCQLSTGVYIAVGYDISFTTIEAQIITVSGTTIILGSAATGPTAAFSTPPVIDAGSATSLLIGFYNATSNTSNIVAVSISGTTITFGTATALTTASNTFGAVIVSMLTSSTYFVAYTSAGNGYKCVVATVSGTTISVGSAVTSTDNMGLSNTTYAYYPTILQSAAYPFATGASGVYALFFYKYSAGEFIIAGKTLTAYSVSGTTVTAGTQLNSAATASTLCQNVDGSWIYSENSASPVTRFFTLSGVTITPGTIIESNFNNPIFGYSATNCAGNINISGIWYPYNVVNNYQFPISTTGQALTGSSLTGRAVYVQDYYQ